MIARLDVFFRPAAPALRLGLVRVAVGFYTLVLLLARSGHLVSVTRLEPAQFTPVGVVSWLSAPLPPAVVFALVGASLLAALPFVLGYRFAATGPLFAGLLLWVTSYRNSYGMIFHTENLPVLTCVVLALSPSADALSLDARAGRAGRALSGRSYGGPLRLLAMMTAVTYVIAGVTKLRNSGADWVTGDTLRYYVALDNARKIELGDSHSPLVAPLLRHARLFVPMAAVSLVVELGAPLALVHRRVAQLWALAAWGFHVGVLALMWIFFPYPLLGFAYLPFVRIERLGPVRRVLRRLRGR